MIEDLFYPSPFRREIDNHFHLQLISDNTEQIIEYQERAFRHDREEAIQNLRALAAVGTEQDRANIRLEEIAHRIAYQTDVIREGFEEVSDELRQLNAAMEDLVDAVNEQTRIIHAGFEKISGELAAQRQILSEIRELIRNPDDTGSSEWLREAIFATKKGGRNLGRDRKAHFDDAMRLLSDVVNNSIGSRNCVAWFYMGWLFWKEKANFPQAAEAFFHAARLSDREHQCWYVPSLRHLAELQYLQGQFFHDAHTTIQKAIIAAPEDFLILFDAARYAAKIGKDDEAVQLLERVIYLRPETITTMFREVDFRRGPLERKLLSLRTRLIIAESDLNDLIATIARVRQASSLADHAVLLPTELSEPAVEHRVGRVNLASYELLVHKSPLAQKQVKAVLEIARSSMTEQLQQCTRSIEAARKKIEVATSNAEQKRTKLCTDAEAQFGGTDWSQIGGLVGRSFFFGLRFALFTVFCFSPVLLISAILGFSHHDWKIRGEFFDDQTQGVFQGVISLAILVLLVFVVGGALLCFPLIILILWNNRERDSAIELVNRNLASEVQGLNRQIARDQKKLEKLEEATFSLNPPG